MQGLQFALRSVGKSIAAGLAYLRFSGINSEEIFQADFMRPESCSSFKAAPAVSVGLAFNINFL